ncbi:MAG: DUF4271 domain-containing protein [Saprospiraceae bacterium]|nr:DUF4271 domain-containing protein [Bacteroidia bacterium]NNK89980.1 DUF4271 domain-containing protein [Saprospiraceae bacterium]
MKLFWFLFLTLIFPFTLQGQKENPFDVFRDKDTVFIKATESILQNDNISEPTKIEGDNPFDISHIPIRKNQYEEIENLSFKKDEGKKETIAISYGPLWALTLSLCLLAYMIFIKKDHFMTLLRSLFNDNFLRVINYEQNGGKNLIYILGYILFILNIGLFIYLVLTELFELDNQFGVLFLAIALIIFYVGKHIVNSIFSKIFYVSRENEIYDFTIITFYNFISIFFLVINILIVFGPNVWIKPMAATGVFIYIAFLLLRYYKGLRIGRNFVRQYYFHFFLYFCAFEFSPWVITYTLVKDLFL